MYCLVLIVYRQVYLLLESSARLSVGGIVVVEFVLCSRMMQLVKWNCGSIMLFCVVSQIFFDTMKLFWPSKIDEAFYTLYVKWLR